MKNYKPKRTRKLNSFIEMDDCILVRATNSRHVFKVDKDAWSLLKHFSWSTNGTQNYLQTRIGSKIWFLHRFLFRKQLKKGYIVHHRTYDFYDNRKSNLEMLTTKQHGAIHSQLRKLANENKAILKESL